MDLATGLAAASQSLTILKQIKELDGAIEQAVVKEKLLELQESALDARAALLEAKTASLEKDERIAELEKRLKAITSGDACPVCRVGHLATIRVVSPPTFGKAGIQEKQLSCENENCSHTEKRLHDPTGIMSNK